MMYMLAALAAMEVTFVGVSTLQTMDNTHANEHTDNRAYGTPASCFAFLKAQAYPGGKLLNLPPAPIQTWGA